MRKYVLCLLPLIFLVCSPCFAAQTVPLPPREGAAMGGGKNIAVAGHGSGNGWVHAEEGIRPAYVGIQGGTAPVSLMKGANGEIFAFTGKTGNDFAVVVKGRNVNGSSSAGASASVPIKKDGPDTELMSTKATPQRTESRQAALAAPVKDTAKASRPTNIQISELKPQENKKDQVVFADSNLSTRLSEAPDEFSPFGLSQADTRYNVAPEPPKARADQPVQVTPLRLRDYRQAI